MPDSVPVASLTCLSAHLRLSHPKLLARSSAGARGQKRKVSDGLNEDEGQGGSFKFDINGNAVSSRQLNYPRAPNTEGEQNASEDGTLIAHAPNGPVAGGGEGPGRPARAGCTRNGQNARASKKHKTSHRALSGEEGEDDDNEEEEEDLEEEKEEEEEGTEGGRRDEEVSGWLISEVPAASSIHGNSFATPIRLVAGATTAELQRYSLHQMTRNYLGSSWDEGDSDSDSESNLEDLYLQSDFPIFVDNIDSQEEVETFSTFCYESKKNPFPKGVGCQSWTEEHRERAEEGIQILTLEELAVRMRERYYDDKEESSKPGRLKNSQKWLRVSNTLIKGYNNPSPLAILSNTLVPFFLFSMANNKKSSAQVPSRSTHSSTSATTRSTRSSTVTSATGKSSSAVTASSKSITKSKAANVKNRGASPAPSSTCLSRPPLGPRAAEYVELQAQRSEEEKRKKDIREKVKAVKASEEADMSEEEEITATSPPATSDVDKEEFNQVFGRVEGAEEDHVSELDEDQIIPQEDDEEVEEFQDMEVDMPDNGIDVGTMPPIVGSTFSSPSKRSSIQAAVARNKLRQRLNVSPTKTHTKCSYSSPEKCKVYKVTSNMFTPHTRKLAVAGKRNARRVSTIEDAFPSDKHAFFLDVARQTAAEESLVDVFESIKEDTDVQKLLTSFMGYARGGMFTSLAKKAREFTASYYCLPGTRKATEVKDMVDWLISDGHFKYRGINIESRTFDNKKPFEANGIAHLLRLEYFATKGDANIAVFKEMVAAKRIKGPTIALMVTILEHSLMEYSDGTYRNSEFTDSAHSCYYHHLSSYKRIAEAAPTWADRFEAKLFNLVLNQSNKTFLLDVEANDMNEVDLAELEASAVAASNSGGASSSTEA
ncbi:hypothetical protein FB446DRAFT_794009 [Lentinula raphanica]|nr:hypothetical protein FB446DRAFT_794009 [Lentinula raphanica]